jgi:hypothetical protein
VLLDEVKLTIKINCAQGLVGLIFSTREKKENYTTLTQKRLSLSSPLLLLLFCFFFLSEDTGRRWLSKSQEENLYREPNQPTP